VAAGGGEDFQNNVPLGSQLITLLSNNPGDFIGGQFHTILQLITIFI